LQHDSYALLLQKVASDSDNKQALSSAESTRKYNDKNIVKKRLVWFTYVQAGMCRICMKGKAIDHDEVKDASPKRGDDAEVS
jgi:hypothetical protein